MAESASNLDPCELSSRPDHGVRPPRWALELVAGASEAWLKGSDGIDLCVADAGEVAMVTAVVANAVEMPAALLEEQTRASYRLICERLAGLRAARPVRVWNFIPGILQPLDGMPQRYMAFNAGRFRAYEEWFEGPVGFSRKVPTASGVGHHGRDLSIHCLALAEGGEPVENPRQVPSYRYSRRWGQLPPCFARATRVSLSPARPPWLLVGGTASVRGEESLYGDDLDAQTEETFANLAALVRSAAAGTPFEAVAENATDEDLLGCFRFLRVYYVDVRHQQRVRQLVARYAAQVGEVEFLLADLCRTQLLVEIEGLVELALPTRTRDRLLRPVE